MYAYCPRPLTESLSITSDSSSELMGQTVDDPNRTIVRLPPGEKAGFIEDSYSLTERLEMGDATLKQKGPELHYE
jgi:hypothetical protein